MSLVFISFTTYLLSSYCDIDNDIITWSLLPLRRPAAL